jgi:hypothetical protein
MKMRCFLVTALFLIFAVAAPAQQQWSDPKLISDVAFDFVVNGTTLPAGTYVVRTFVNGHALMIQNRDKPGYMRFVSNDDIMLPLGRTHNSTGFVFALDKGQHVLHQITLEGDNHTHDIIHGNDVAELVANR